MVLRVVWALIGGSITSVLAAHSACTRLPCSLPEPGGSLTVTVQADWPWPTQVQLVTLSPAVEIQETDDAAMR